MGKATIEYPLTDICGKVNKSDSAYFSHLNGKTFIRRIKNPYKGPSTAKQIAIKDKFTRISHEVTQILLKGESNAEFRRYASEYKANPGKYATLRGYIFAELYSHE